MRSLPIALLIGCTGCYFHYLSRPGELPPDVAAVDPAQRTAAWNRAISALVASGWVPQLLNEGACYIGAKRRDDLDNDKLAGALASVQIDPDGTVIVQVAGGGLFRSQNDLDATIKAAQDQILSGVMGAPLAPGRR